MKKMKGIFIALAVTALLGGCARTAPILTPQTSVTANVSADKVKTAILEAGQKRDWIMKQTAPGVIEGKLISRDHTVRIKVTYSATSYKISYVDSQNLKASDGKIHKNYNRWVNNLDKDIQLRLAAL
ncbi:hypothetical protein [Morganella psychrotolerans]|uniref:Lipoprotein n=1 Tax=Morganella psychrotolerans TaxID=368603 RepID=A0A1B8HNY7_9GAMM|nr:hypothetical protein [Morganella psychrotolerans]OBU11093.1 hypothetical protein AYY18_03945 [Morganella psychrotolerans]